MGRAITIRLNAVIVAVTGDEPRILTVTSDVTGRGAAQADALPFGPLDPDTHRTLELGLRAWVREQAGFELGYVEQLYTFGDRDREDRPSRRRVLSVAYLALVRESGRLPARAQWRDWYSFFPWEDRRSSRSSLVDGLIAARLGAWAAAAGAARRTRRERSDIAFGQHGARWDEERVLERYELLYEGGLVAESARDGRASPSQVAAELGRPMTADHRRILATALGRLRGKLKYRPVVFELLPPLFTLSGLQRVVEALVGVRLHKGNFRRLVEKARLVEGTGRLEEHTGGRPAELFRFRREVLRERRAPGVGLPAARRLTAGSSQI